MATPFIDSLPVEKREYVEKFTKKVRPSYYDSALEATAKGLSETVGGSLSENSSNFDPNVQISEDLEAVLILAAREDKVKLIEILTFLITNRKPGDEAELMDEVLATRADSFKQVAADLVAGTRNSIAVFEAVRTNIFSLLITTPALPAPGIGTSAATADRQRGQTIGNQASGQSQGIGTSAATGNEQSITTSDEATAILIPELSKMFNSINVSLSDISKPELMAAHDLVVDKLVTSYYSSSWFNKVNELTSWVNVVQQYLTLIARQPETSPSVSPSFGTSAATTDNQRGQTIGNQASGQSQGIGTSTATGR